MEPSEFDKWICSTPELEEYFGEDIFFKLISFNYFDQNDIKEARQLVSEIYHEYIKSDMVRDKICFVLECMLSGNLDLAKGCNILWKFSLNGVGFIPPVFSGYASELKDSKWESYYHDRILKDSKVLLDKLTNNVKSTT